MGFYDELAVYYDELFPLKENTYEFLKTYVKSGKVLDVGCSTGAYATRLNEEDELFVRGIDLNEDMIHLANKRIGSASFEVKDMREIDGKNAYSMIYSIGNTIVHLEDYDEIKQVVKQMLDALKKNGVLILQIVNYARIFRQAVSELPLIETKHVKFHRYYQHKDGKLLFKSVLKTKMNKLVSEVLLYPLTKAELEMMAEELKVKITFYGSFEKEPFKEDSFHLIAVIEK
jgi:2-polyprenyl-3-methyl-5-hydroxy-6-metoxy-1,4-benzoquinol methylase